MIRSQPTSMCAFALLSALFPFPVQAAPPADPVVYNRSPVGIAVAALAAGLTATKAPGGPSPFRVTCVFPATPPMLMPATLGGPLQPTVGPPLDCIPPSIRIPSTPTGTGQTLAATDAPLERGGAPAPASLSDTDVRTSTVAAPPARMISPDPGDCGPPGVCEPLPAGAVEMAVPLLSPAREPDTPQVPTASWHLGAGVLSWLGLWLVLWLALMGLFGLGAWAFYRRRLAPDARLIRAAEAGLRRGEFRVEYEPVISLREGTCVGVEAMIRWANAEYGSRGPAYYMRILENTRLIGRLTRFVLSTAAQELAEPTAGSALFIGVNVSAAHVESKGFASDVSRSANAILSQLVLNMPQRGCAAPTADVLHALATLRARHVRFALANVDEVPSDPDRLQIFGFDQLRIDRHLMTLDEDERLQCLTAVASAVRPLGATVIAEGVESARHHVVARQAGVDLGQGFFYGRAMTFSLLLTFLETGGISLRMRKKGR